MTKDLMIINGLILLYILQRVGELLFSKGNEVWLKHHHHAVEIDPRESLRMRIFHTSWFVALILESNYRHSFQTPIVSLIVYVVLGACVMIRLHSMEQLKRFWSIKVFSMNAPDIATNGLYRYVRHPNYFIVICELFLLPFLFKAYFTMILFSIGNLYILSKRIQAEESALMFHHDYKKHFQDKKRFIPFVFMLCLGLSPLKAKELSVHTSSYDEAKKNENYLKFQSTSTKLGFITTSFDGYAKDFKANYDEKEQMASNIEVVVAVKSLDTDISSRDEKMHNEVMNAEKFPTLKVVSVDALKLTPGEQKINMNFFIKDKQLTRAVVFNLSPKDKGWQITGKTQLGLQEMGLPDPSIAIAKVRDQFDIEFGLILREK